MKIVGCESVTGFVQGANSQKMTMKWNFSAIQFLVACTRLYNPLCRSVRPSVGPSVGRSIRPKSLCPSKITWRRNHRTRLMAISFVYFHSNLQQPPMEYQKRPTVGDVGRMMQATREAHYGSKNQIDTWELAKEVS